MLAVSRVKAVFSRSGTGLAHTAFWALGDQCLVSAMNFITMVLLAREISSEAFGEFTLVYSGLLLSSSFVGSLIMAPHNVLGAVRQGEDYKTYTSSCAFGQLTLSVLAAALILVVAIVAQASDRSYAGMLLILAPTVVAWVGQEFVRRVLYTEGRPFSAFLNDAVSYGGQALGVLTLWLTGNVTATSILLVIAISSSAAGLAGLYQLRRSLVWRFDVSLLKENWTFGSWLVGANVVGLVALLSYRFILALTLGPSSTALVAAADICMRPLGILSNAIDSFLSTRFARALQRDGFVAQEVRRVLLLTGPLLLAYGLFILLFGQQLMDTIFRDKYPDAQLLLALYVVYYLLFFVSILISSLLRAGRSTRIMFFIAVGNLCTTLLLGWTLVELTGPEGAVLSSIVNGLIWGIAAMTLAPVRAMLSRGAEATTG